jgi:hypothetical protein
MASRLSTSRIVLGVVAGLVLLFVLAEAGALGLPGALIMAGLALALLGLGAAVVGRARWAFITSRKVAGGVADAGVAALIVGGATAPTPEPTAATSTPAPASTAPDSPTDGEAAIRAAEESLADAETASPRRRLSRRSTRPPGCSETRRLLTPSPVPRPPPRSPHSPRWRSRGAPRAPATTGTGSATAGSTPTATAATPATTCSPAT